MDKNVCCIVGIGVGVYDVPALVAALWFILIQNQKKMTTEIL
jgi:hypothetical protein